VRVRVYVRVRACTFLRVCVCACACVCARVACERGGAPRLRKDRTRGVICGAGAVEGGVGGGDEERDDFDPRWSSMRRSRDRQYGDGNTLCMCTTRVSFPAEKSADADVEER
jgi:hypothetical protein